MRWVFEVVNGSNVSQTSCWSWKKNKKTVVDIYSQTKGSSTSIYELWTTLSKKKNFGPQNPAVNIDRLRRREFG